jgi:hypothetical protein
LLKHGVLLAGGELAWIWLTGCAACKIDGLDAQQPQFVSQILEMIHQWNMRA